MRSRFDCNTADGDFREKLMRLLSYDPETGVFTWKVKQGGANPGQRAGIVKRLGYVRIKIDGRQYWAHRLAWLYMTGNWPRELIDHIDGVRDNNKFQNLREATYRENSRNSKTPSSNTSGYKGVGWRAQSKKWRAYIKTGGRWKHIGLFETAEEAHAAYVAEAQKHHGEFARAS